jgi:hypothetical protein
LAVGGFHSEALHSERQRALYSERQRALYSERQRALDDGTLSGRVAVVSGGRRRVLSGRGIPAAPADHVDT